MNEKKSNAGGRRAGRALREHPAPPTVSAGIPAEEFFCDRCGDRQPVENCQAHRCGDGEEEFELLCPACSEAADCAAAELILRRMVQGDAGAVEEFFE